MDYKKIYTALIERAKLRTESDCYEIHHVVPRCMGGDDNKLNLVKLTPEEHYVAHQLLVKIYPDNYKLVLAAAMMIPQRKSNKMYGWLKRKHRAAASINQSGKKNSQYGCRWIHNNELRESKRIDKFDPLPQGWVIGRKINFDPKPIYCCVCSTKFFSESSKIKFCSYLCKKKSTETIATKTIDENLEDMIALFQEHKSITKVLNSYNLIGRQGNSYFSKILKKKGHKILKRRNSD